MESEILIKNKIGCFFIWGQLIIEIQERISAIVMLRNICISKQGHYAIPPFYVNIVTSIKYFQSEYL